MLGIHKPANVAGSSRPAIIIGAFVAFGGLLFGYDTGTIGGILAMDFWVKEFAQNHHADGTPYISASQKSLIVSILSAGTFFGALTAAPAGDFLGRRWGLIVSTLIFSVGVIFQTAATETVLFSIGRFIAGYGVGLVSALVPLYQSESAPKWIRGAIVGAYQFAITVGLLLAACVNQGTHARNDSGSYRIPVALQFLWAIILIGGMLVLPETPRFLIKKDKYDEALKSMSRLRALPIDHPVLIEELEEIRANHEFETQAAKGGAYIDCFRDGMLKRLLTGMGLQALQQLTGINFIFYYGTNFFKDSGIDNPFLIGLITNLVNVVSTLPGLYLVERMGRRNLLLFGAIGMAVSQFVVAIVGVTAASVVANKVLIAFVCIYIFFFACSWGPVAWVVTGEMFPLKVRAKALSITTATNWLLNFAIGYATPYLVDPGEGNADLGAKVFFLWGGCCFICTAFVYLFIYETKGLSLEQIDELYETVGNAWNSMHFVPSQSYADRVHHSDKAEEVKTEVAAV
ncbi:general substrate transporter [Peziza echinospora]|nr:general substrate transporter [Peziza echinospora]